MTRVFFIAMLMIVNNKTFAMPLTDHEWYCKTSSLSTKINYFMEHRISFNENGFLDMKTTINFVDPLKEKESQVFTLLHGNYNYSSDTLTFDELLAVDVIVAKDELGILTTTAIDELKTMLNLNSDAVYKTLRLSNHEWVSEHSISGEKMTCYKN